MQKVKLTEYIIEFLKSFGDIREHAGEVWFGLPLIFSRKGVDMYAYFPKDLPEYVFEVFKGLQKQRYGIFEEERG